MNLPPLECNLSDYNAVLKNLTQFNRHDSNSSRLAISTYDDDKFILKVEPIKNIFIRFLNFFYKPRIERMPTISEFTVCFFEANQTNAEADFETTIQVIDSLSSHLLLDSSGKARLDTLRSRLQAVAQNRIHQMNQEAVQQAQEKIAKATREAEQQKRNILNKATAKQTEILAEADLQKDFILAEAEVQSKKILADAKKEQESMLALILKEAELEKGLILTKAKVQSGEIFLNMEKERELKLTEILKEAEQLKESILVTVKTHETDIQSLELKKKQVKQDLWHIQTKLTKYHDTLIKLSDGEVSVCLDVLQVIDYMKGLKNSEWKASPITSEEKSKYPNLEYTLSFDNHSEATFRLLIQYIENPKKFETILIDPNQLLELYFLANELQYENLIKACLEKITKHQNFDLKAALGLLEQGLVGRLYSRQDPLLQHVCSIVATRFPQVIQNKGLEKIDLDTLIMLLKSDDLSIINQDEYQFFHDVKSWVEEKLKQNSTADTPQDKEVWQKKVAEYFNQCVKGERLIDCIQIQCFTNYQYETLLKENILSDEDIKKWNAYFFPSFNVKDLAQNDDSEAVTKGTLVVTRTSFDRRYRKTEKYEEINWIINLDDATKLSENLQSHPFQLNQIPFRLLMINSSYDNNQKFVALKNSNNSKIEIKYYICVGDQHFHERELQVTLEPGQTCGIKIRLPNLTKLVKDNKLKITLTIVSSEIKSELSNYRSQ